MKIDYEAHYDDSYWQGRKTYKDGQGKEKIYHGPSLAWEGFQFIADTLTPLLPKGSLLDIGCSGGDLANRLRLNGFDSYGVDISTYALKNCVDGMRDRVALCDITACPEVINSWHHTEDGWPVFPAQFDNLIATDLLVHIYEEDLNSTFDWMLSKTKKSMFFCVATASWDKEEFVARKGQPIPPEFEGTAVAGHLNVRQFYKYWCKFFIAKNLTIRWDLMYRFQARREQIEPWKNTPGWNMATTVFLDKK